MKKRLVQNDGHKLVRDLMARQPDDIDRISYLHDGRARTLDEAIRWHGGEAEASKLAYLNLNSSDQQSLITFLNSL